MTRVSVAILFSTAIAAPLIVGGAPVEAQRVKSVAVHDVPAPQGGRIVICHGYGCFHRTPIQLSPADLRRLRAILRRGSSGPKAERQAISAAIQWFERRVGRALGTSADQLGSPPSGAGDPTQLDCIDHSLNTMHLLNVAAENGWLSHHVVDRPRTRGFLIDGRYPHSSAVIRATAGGGRWAVDPWASAHGQPPKIMPLEVWLRAG